MQLVLVRHALPYRVNAAELGEAGGPGEATVADPGLPELGERQAVRLVGALAGENVAALYTSRMARAVGTAVPLASALGRQPQRVADLDEYDADLLAEVPVPARE